MALATGARVRLVGGAVGTAEQSRDAETAFRFRPDDYERATTFVKVAEIAEVLEEPEVDVIEPEDFGARPVAPGTRGPSPQSSLERRIGDILAMPVLAGS